METTQPPAASRNQHCTKSWTIHGQKWQPAPRAATVGPHCITGPSTEDMALFGAPPRVAMTLPSPTALLFDALPRVTMALPSPTALIFDAPPRVAMALPSPTANDDARDEATSEALRGRFDSTSAERLVMELLRDERASHAPAARASTRSEKRMANQS